MALEDFYPWTEGDKIKPEHLNELVELIQDGTIFQNTGYITEQLHTNGTRLTGLEERVTRLEGIQGLLNIREQFSMTAGQVTVGLSKIPSLDTELVFLNGLSLSKTGIPLGFVGDYSLTGNTLTFNSELSSQIIAGDVLVVVYRYEA